MRQQSLGRTGFKVSEIGHGLWGMGDWTDSEVEQSITALDMSAELGCSFYDSAWAYGDGKSDALLGKALARNAQKSLVAATKVPPKNLQWPPTAGSSYQEVFPHSHVFDYTRRSLAALNIDSIDLLQFHVWDDRWADQEEFRETVEQLKSEGLIRSFGLSLNRWESENGIAAINTDLVDCVQVIYNIFDQAPEDHLFPLCRERNIGVIARVPLDEGSLGGNLTKETRFPDNDFRSIYFGPENLPETVDRIESLKSLLPENMTLAELAVRFILSNKDVSTMIIGMRQARHIQANIDCSDKGPLDENLHQKLRQHRWDRRPTSWSC